MASILEQNTDALQAILDAVNALPDGDGTTAQTESTESD